MKKLFLFSSFCFFFSIFFCLFPHLGFTDSNLVGYWPMEEDGGQTAYDESGNNNHGTLGATTDPDDRDPAWVKGKVGFGLYFGGNDAVLVDDSDSLDLSTALTLEAWVKPGTDSLVGNKGIIGKPYAYGLVLADGKLRLGMYLKDTTWTIHETPTQVVQVGEWSHLAATYDSTTGTVRLYVNGEEKYSGIDTVIINPNTKTLRIGVLNKGTFFKGRIDEVKIYSRVLDTDEIAREYRRATLAARWSMEEGDGQTVNDMSGNNNHGTLGADADPDDHDPTWVEGRSGSGLYFDGNDAVLAPASESLKLRTALTLQVWVKPDTDSLVDSKGIIGKPYAYGLMLINGFPALALYINGVGWATHVDSTTRVEVDQWSRITATYDSSVQEVKLYVNGNENYSGVQSGLVANSSVSLRIGVMRRQSFFQGTIDEVRIYDRALSLEEVEGPAISVTPLTMPYIVLNEEGTAEQVLKIQNLGNADLNFYIRGIEEKNLSASLDEKKTLIREDVQALSLKGLQEGAPHVEDEILVKFKEGINLWFFRE